MSMKHCFAVAVCVAGLTSCGAAEEKAVEPDPVLIEVLSCDGQPRGSVRGTYAHVLAAPQSEFMPVPKGRVEITFKLRGELVAKDWGDLKAQFGTTDEYRQPEVATVAVAYVTAPRGITEVDECLVTGYQDALGEPAPFREASHIASNAGLDALRGAGWKSESER